MTFMTNFRHRMLYVTACQNQTLQRAAMNNHLCEELHVVYIISWTVIHAV